jgi:hypothetical protein
MSETKTEYTVQDAEKLVASARALREQQGAAELETWLRERGLRLIVVQQAKVAGDDTVIVMAAIKLEAT